MIIPSKRCILVSANLLTVFARSRGSASSSGATGATGANAAAPRSTAGESSGGSDWIANGATACEKYLTPDVAAAIVPAPAGMPQRLDAHSCHTGIIYIDLNVADIGVFRRELPRIAGPHPLAGARRRRVLEPRRRRLFRQGPRSRLRYQRRRRARANEDPRRRPRTAARRDLQPTLRSALACTSQ